MPRYDDQSLRTDTPEESSPRSSASSTVYSPCPRTCCPESSALPERVPLLPSIEDKVLGHTGRIAGDTTANTLAAAHGTFRPHPNCFMSDKKKRKRKRNSAVGSTAASPNCRPRPDGPPFTKSTGPIQISSTQLSSSCRWTSSRTSRSSF